MKKFFIFLIIGSILFSMLPVQTKAEGEKTNLIANAKSGILIEESTGKIIFEKNKDEKLAIASLTKMVAQILILEQVEKGNLKWDEMVTVSKNASDMGGSQIYLSTGEVMTVRDLMKGISMASANDATVAMAEKIAGTEMAFVKLMNDKVKELGLKNTVFKNSTGLDEEGHYSTAYDLAIIARELLKHEEILEFSSVYEDYLRTDTPNKFWLVNTNKLVRFYEGADGLKTGHTDNALYCLAATAKIDGMRLIAIVLGEEVSKVRNQEAMSLLDYGYSMYKVNVIKTKDNNVGQINLDKASKEKIYVYPIRDIGILMSKTEKDKKYDIKIDLNDVTLPLKSGDIVGKAQVLNENKVIDEVELIVKENVEKSSFLKLFLKNLEDIVTGKITIK